jgi:hypothetical protein
MEAVVFVLETLTPLLLRPVPKMPLPDSILTLLALLPVWTLSDSAEKLRLLWMSVLALLGCNWAEV